MMTIYTIIKNNYTCKKQGQKAPRLEKRIVEYNVNKYR